MLHPDIAYDIASGQRKAMVAQAAAIAQVRAARRIIRGSGGKAAPALLSRIWVSLRPRTAEPEATRQARWGQRWSFELTSAGPDVTIVTETFDCSRVPEDQRVDIDNGNIWVESMHRTLERLDQLCTRPPGAAVTPD